MRFRTLFGTFIILFAACLARAQNTRGTLRGTVQDPSGARIPSAKIVVDAADFAFNREGASNNRGEFRIDDLPIATYHIVVSANGFADAISDVQILLSSVREITVTLKPCRRQADRHRPRRVFFHHHAIPRRLQRRPSNRHQFPGPRDHPPRRPQLRQHRLPRPRHRTRRAFRPHQSPHHRCFHRRQFRPEQRTLRGRRRQLRRLHRRLPAKFLSRSDPRIRRAHGTGRCRHRAHHRGLRGHHHQARHQRLARRRCIL